MSDIVLTKPTAYIYGGHRLPELTCMSEYPYVIIYQDTQSEYQAYCSASPITTKLTDDGKYDCLVREAPHRVCSYVKYNEDWSYTDYTSQSSTYIYALGTPIWSSHKITAPDGSTYIKASKAPSALYEGNTEVDDFEFDLYSFNVGLVFGLTDDLDLIDSSMFEEDEPVIEPVAYLYNGFRASAIPEYDKDIHPYVVLCLYDLMSAISRTDKLKVYFLSDINITNDLYDSNGTYKDYVWYAPGDKSATATRPYDSTGDFTEFGEVSELSDSLKFGLENIIWTNTDLYNTDGTLYLAASEPVPVYE